VRLPGLGSKLLTSTAVSDNFFKIPSKTRMHTLICPHITAILLGHH
jgi:hypothetical protein